MTDLSVKHYHSGMPGAPVLSNNWGDLTGLLDACLVNGFHLRTIDTLTSASGIATATVSGGHSYEPHQVVRIEGAVQAPYNGEHRVLTTTTTTFTYAVAGAPASPATTSTSLSARIAPLGWEKPFTATHRGAYRSRNPQSPQNLLLVNNALKTPGYTTTWAKWANVGIVEGLSDINTIIGAQAPFSPTAPLQNWQQTQANQWGWFKWYYARVVGAESSGDGGAGGRNWVIVGDDRLFFFFCNVTPAHPGTGRCFYCFGDISSFKPADNYGTVLCADDHLLGNTGTWSYPGQFTGDGLCRSLDVTGKLLLRNHSQLGNPVGFGVTSLNTNNGNQICGRGTMPFPNGADLSLWLLPAYVQQADGHMRGTMPGMMWMPQDRPYPDMTIVDNVVGQPGRRFLLVMTPWAGLIEGAQVAVDITGPWR